MTRAKRLVLAVGKPSSDPTKNAPAAPSISVSPTLQAKSVIQALEKIIGIKNPTEWFKISHEKLIAVAKENQIAMFTKLQYYKSKNFKRGLAAVYPEIHWEPHKFLKHFSYNDPKYQLDILRRVEAQLNIVDPEQWYQFTFKEAQNAAKEIEVVKPFSFIVQNLHGGLIKALRHYYPNVQWNPLKCKWSPRGALADKETHLTILKMIEPLLNINDPEDWYKVTGRMVRVAAKKAGICGNYASVCTHYYHSSFATYVQKCYPNVQWDLKKFAYSPGRTYNDPSVHTDLFKQLENQLGITQPLQWYEFYGKDVIEAAGRLGFKKAFLSIFFTHYNGSLLTLLRAMYPDIQWDAFKMKRSPITTLDSTEKHRELIKKIEQLLKIERGQQDKWYKQSLPGVVQQLTQLGEEKLASMIQLITRKYYKGSLIWCIQTLFPEYDLQEYLYTKLPAQSYSNFNVLVGVVREIEQKLIVEKMEDWYRISQKQIQAISKLYVIQKNGGLQSVLPMVYPNYSWNFFNLYDRYNNFNGSKLKKSQQRLLLTFVKKLLRLEDSQIYEDFPMEGMYYKNTQDQIILDIYVPHMQLAVEYNGQQHYKEVRYFGSTREYQLRDDEKQRLCAERGIKLIIVPYTWDSTMESVQAILSKAIQQM